MSPVAKEVVLKYCSDEKCNFTTHVEEDVYCGYCGSDLIIKCEKCNSIHTRLDLKHCTRCKANLRSDVFDFGDVGI